MSRGNKDLNSFKYDCEKRLKIESYCRDLILSNDHIFEMEKRMRTSICRGLKKETHGKSSVKCYPTFVRELPRGNETGKFLAIDLGGTHFRIVCMDMEQIDRESFFTYGQSFDISVELKTGPGIKLFDYIAECLLVFVRTNNIIDENLSLGFTFSFPCYQEGLKSGRLIKWTKGFQCSGVIGQDVVAMLQQSFIRKGLKYDVVALLNDTTGTLVSCAWRNPKCRIGMIIGTGTNACYLENVENVELMGPTKTHALERCP